MKTKNSAQRIDLSQHRNLSLHFVNGDGGELLNMDFSRDADASPVIHVNIIGKTGDVQTGLVMFDVRA